MIQLEVWGAYALFSRPELKWSVFPTTSRPLRRHGALWKRSIFTRVYVGTSIKFMCSTPSASSASAANEVASKISGRNVRQAAQGGGQPLYLAAPQEIVQRASLLLQDVHYVIEAHFDMTDKAAPSDNPGKFQDIVTRRMERGQCFHTPYFGCREFPAAFRRWPGRSRSRHRRNA